MKQKFNIIDFLSGDEIDLVKAEQRWSRFAIEFRVNNLEMKSIVYSLGLGCAVDWLSPDLVHNKSPLFNRINHAYHFSKKEKVLVFLDCSSFKNFATFRGYHHGINELTDKEWGVPPDFINNFKDYKTYALQQFPQWNEKNSKQSIAKMLTSPLFFPGVGGYLRTEMLHKLWKLWNVEPWTQCGILSLESNNIFMILLGIFRVLVKNLASFYPHYDLSKHNIPKVKVFYYSYLEAYRKPATTLWHYSSAGSKKGTVYTFCPGFPSSYIQKKKKVGQKVSVET